MQRDNTGLFLQGRTVHRPEGRGAQTGPEWISIKFAYSNQYNATLDFHGHSEVFVEMIKPKDIVFPLNVFSFWSDNPPSLFFLFSNPDLINGWVKNDKTK